MCHDCLSGQLFKDLVEPYLLAALSRGIPSLFADLKSLYISEEKRQAIGDYVDGLRTFLSPADEMTGSGGEASHCNAISTLLADVPIDLEHEPSTYLWTLYFLAQHHSYISPTRPIRAMELLDVAFSHTPTLPELHMIKARTLKRAGDPTGASKAMEDARRLDRQDRFINTKSAKYLMRDGQTDAASLILGLFTKVCSF